MIGGRGITLTWPTSDGATGYEVAISSAGTSPTITSVLGTSAGVMGLVPGTVYIFTVAATNTHGTTRSDEHRATAPAVTQVGHQADHTVKYVIDNNIGNNIVRDAVAPAVVTWNSALQSLGKGLRICTGPTCDTDNTDNFTVTIRTANHKSACLGSRACVDSDSKRRPSGRHGHDF